MKTPIGNYTRQLELETLQTNLDIDRYRSVVARAVEHGAETRTDYGQLLMRRLVQPVEDALSEWLDQQAANTSRKATAYKYLARFPEDCVVAVPPCARWWISAPTLWATPLRA